MAVVTPLFDHTSFQSVAACSLYFWVFFTPHALALGSWHLVYAAALITNDNGLYHSSHG
jgi:hypothetical protein